MATPTTTDSSSELTAMVAGDPELQERLRQDRSRRCRRSRNRSAVTNGSTAWL